MFCVSNNNQIVMLAERHSRYVMLVKVAEKRRRNGSGCANRERSEVAQELYRSLTWSRSKEMAAHKRFILATNITVYFSDPQNPQQRGTNESTNGLLR